MERNYAGRGNVSYSNRDWDWPRERQYRRPKSNRNNYYSTNERMMRGQGSTVNPKVLNGLIFLTIFFAILTSIAYIGVIYTVICSLGISIIALMFFRDKLEMFFPEEDSAPDNTQRSNRYTRGYTGLSSEPGLYSQNFCNTKRIHSTVSDQTPVEFTFDSSLIGNESDDAAQARLARMNFPDMKYKSAVMSYGDLNSDSYIRMSKNVNKMNVILNRNRI